ncbi:MAG: hypothetical protein HDT40_07685 [Lachnospiraceae bacterium]|nr:hypothetical protein [Lachnospiraceae bacterium]
MEKLAVRQNVIEQKYREQYIKQQRDKFIIKYKNDANDIYYLSLCWISAIYDSTLSYHREMYREYNMLEEDVKNAICEYMNLKLQKPEKLGDDFYYQCVNAISKQQYKYNSKGDNFSIFYEGAKYLHKCIKSYKNEYIPIKLYELNNRFTDLLFKYKKCNDHCFNPIKQFSEEFNFSGVDELVACEICAVVANCLAYEEIDFSFNTEEWFCEPLSEQIKTMEDLFLLVLFNAYVYLILPERTAN